MKTRILFASFAILVSALCFGQRSEKVRYDDYQDSIRNVLFKDMAFVYNAHLPEAVGALSDKLIVSILWNPESIVDGSRVQSILDSFGKQRRLAFILALPDTEMAKDSSYVTSHAQAMGWGDMLATNRSNIRQHAFESEATALVIQPGGGYSKYFGQDPVLKMKEFLDFFIASEYSRAEIRQSRYPAPPAIKNVHTILNGPRKVLASEEGNLLFIADSGNNRVLVCDQDGFVQQIIGSGERGFRDESFGQCQLKYPTGLAYDARTQKLYIADSFNHAIRVADLKTEEVQTVLGNGSRSSQFFSSLDGVSGRLNVPTGLELLDGNLFVCNSGQGQLLKMDVKSFKATSFAGSGNLKSKKGKLSKMGFEEMSDVAIKSGNSISVSDKSASRMALLNQKKGKILNKSNALNEEKLIAVKQAFFRGIEGLSWIEGDLWIADAGNNQIKLMTPNNMVTSFLGSGNPGYADGGMDRCDFHCPTSCASLTKNRVAISDYLNNAIRIFNQRKGSVETLKISGREVELRPIALAKKPSAMGNWIILPSVEFGSGFILEFESGNWEVLPEPKSSAYFQISQSTELNLNTEGEPFLLVDLPANRLLAPIVIELDFVLKNKRTGQLGYMRSAVSFMLEDEAMKTNVSSQNARLKLLENKLVLNPS